MMPIMLILVALGLGLVIYAVFEVFKPGKPDFPQKQKMQNLPLSAEDPGKEQKIQRLQSQIAKLESQLEEAKVALVEGKSGSAVTKGKDAEFSVELKRREEWVAKAEAELAKVKAENLDLNNKFITKEKELEEEFTKNVNLSREMREIKAALEAKEMACRLKEDQVQAQKHQIESQLKNINEHLATIAEFNRKEKISEWVPKQEFNQLNAEYTKLEKDLESSQERLKSFAAEIAHLRQEQDKKSPLMQETKLPEEVEIEKAPPEQTKEFHNVPLRETKDVSSKDSQGKTKPAEVIKEENKEAPQDKFPKEDKEKLQVVPQEVTPQKSSVPEQNKAKPIAKEVNPEEKKQNKLAPEETVSEEAAPEKTETQKVIPEGSEQKEIKSEKNKTIAESKAAEWLRKMEENIEKKTKEAEE